MYGEEDKPRLIGINHVALEVGDIEEALRFYGGLFRFTLRGRTEHQIFLDMGDQFLALSEADKSGPDKHRHFGLVVDDRAALKDKLEEVGAEVLETSGLDFLDPWGNRIQVVQYSEIQFSKAQTILEAMGLDDLEKTEDARKQLQEKGLLPDSEDARG